MKSFLKYLFLLSTCFFTALASAETVDLDSCVNKFKSETVSIIDKAIANGNTRIQNLDLTRLRYDIESGKIPTNCDPGMSVSIVGRQSAFYSAGVNPKDNSYLVNYIMLTDQALKAPARTKGLLYFHEFVSALGFSDFSYSYTLTVNKMAEEPSGTSDDIKGLSSSIRQLSASEEGTSTGVGGGDWRTIQLKIKLLEKFKTYLSSAGLSSSESARQLNFFMTLMIDFERDDFFSNLSASTFAFADLFGTGEEMHCKSKKGVRIVIRESVSNAFEDEGNLEKLFKFVLVVTGNPNYGQNALCIKRGS